MPRVKKGGEPPPVKSCVEVRAEVRDYIKNERDTILKKWMALEESVKSEDYRRDAFAARREREDTKSLPIPIRKFIGTLKKAVRKTMRDVGGTPFSIVRAMFLYWDADKSGEMSSEEMKGCMNSLGVKISDAERDEVVAYYDSGKGTNEMSYHELLADITAGEPPITYFVTEAQEEESAKADVRYEEVCDEFVAMPQSVTQFLEATRNYVMGKMRTEGGTSYFHIRFLFQFYDYDYSNGLNASELSTAARKKMKLVLSMQDAQEIVNYYDRKKENQMEYQEFLKDVSIGQKPILHFTDLTPRQIAAAKKSLAANPFMPKPFKATSNRTLETFKANVKNALAIKVNSYGGTVTNWIKEAFTNWDPKLTLRMKSWEHLQGAIKRLGISLTQEESMCLMKCYDKWGTGEMHYMELIKDMLDEDPGIFKDAVSAKDNSLTTSGRVPPKISISIRNFRTSVEAFSRKSAGVLEPRDVLHGTFLRFDRQRSGRLEFDNVQNVARELNVRISDNDLSALVVWFDTNGSSQLDYNSFTRQLFGDDISTKALTLPRLNKLAGSSTYNLSDTYSGTLTGGGGLSATLAARNDPPIATTIQSKNMQVVESLASKAVRLTAKRNLVITEKLAVQSKLASVESQRKKILEDFKARRRQKNR